MHLSRQSDLALRALMLLAAGDLDGERVTAALIGETAGASTSQVSKVVARLVELGAVASRRGRGGGLSITDEGRRFSVGTLMRHLDDAGEVVECEGPQPCPLAGGCRLRRALAEAREAFFVALDPLTVEDLVRPHPRTVPLTLQR